MAEQPDSKQESPGDEAIVAVTAFLAVAAAALFVALPAALAAIGFYATRGKLRRAEYIVVAVTGLLAMLVVGLDQAGLYAGWLFRLVTGNGGVWPLPWPTVAAMTLLMFGAYGLLAGTNVLAAIPVVGERFKPKVGERESVIPTEREKKKLQVAKPPTIVGDASNHSPGLQQTPPGKRPIFIGRDRHGRPVSLSESEIGTHGVILGSTGSGKALALDTRIPTPAGWTTMGQLNVGDRVLGADGKPTRVTFATDVQHDRSCYEVIFSDGSTIVADADHRWLTSTRAGAVRQVATTGDILDTLTTPTGEPNHWVDVAAPLDLPESADPDVAYLMGLLRGGAQCTSGSVQTGDGATLSARPLIGEAAWCLNHPHSHEAGRPLPVEYLRADRATRLALLQGLMDASGTVDKAGTCRLVARSVALAEDTFELAATLGLQPRVGGEDGKREVSFSTVSPVSRRQPLLARIPTSVPDDAGRRYVTDVRAVESVPVRCIQVDNDDHLFLAGDAMIPTHNTVTIKTFMAALLDYGWDAILLDMKEDTQNEGLRDFCRDYVRSHAMPYQEVSLSDDSSPNWFNVLEGLNRDEQRDAILSLTEFDDQHWQNINKNLLSSLLKLLNECHQLDPERFEYPTMYQIGNILSQPSLPAATKEMRGALKAALPGYRDDDYLILQNPDDDAKKSARGFGAKLVQMYRTDAGENVLRPRAADHLPLDVTQPGLAYLGLDTMSKPDLAKVVSSGVLVRLAAYAGQRNTGRNTGPERPKVLIVDEANWVDRNIIQNLLSRARSAGICVFLCTQGPMDWEARDDKPGWDNLTQNINVAVIMAQNNPQSAEMCADYIGTSEVQSITQRFSENEVMEGAGSVSTREEYIVPPEQLRALSVGDAIVRVARPADLLPGESGPSLKWCKIQMREAQQQINAPPRPARPWA